jgi:predicted PurR-regulated permease PerM
MANGGVQQIENIFLVPRILGGSVGIHPAILVVLLIVMGHSFGLLGRPLRGDCS